MKYAFLFLLLGAVAFEVCADILFKEWSMNNKGKLLIFGVGLYFVSTLAWAYSLKLDYLAKAVSIFTILNLIAVLLVGVLYFGEHLSVINKIGIILGVISVIFIQI